MAFRPDDVLILPWNIAGEIAGELRGIDAWGGRLLVAVPRLTHRALPDMIFEADTLGLVW